MTYEKLKRANSLFDRMQRKEAILGKIEEIKNMKGQLYLTGNLLVPDQLHDTILKNDRIVSSCIF